MELVNTSGVTSRPLMEVIDILRDDASQFADLFQPRDGLVGIIWFHLFEESAFRKKCPLPVACLGTREEFVNGKVIGVKTGPDTPGLRKSGMPDSVLTPAPVKTTVLLLAMIKSAKVFMSSSICLPSLPG